MNESSLNLMDVLIHSNIAYSGGAVYGLTTYSPKHLTLLNVTLTSNVGNNSYGALSLNNSISLLTTNSIIWNNGINPILIDYYFDLTHSNVDSELFADNCSDCFSLDPVFVDPENEDFTLGITSPCIDNGTTDWSVIGQNSFNFEWVNDMLDFYGTAPDIGAFESNYILGDLNQDHYLNILDVVILINLILGINTPTDYQLWASDLNQDQIINVLDVITLINIIFDI